MAERVRKVRSVTLNPTLVKALLEYGAATGEKRLSVLLDNAMRDFLARNPVAKPARRGSPLPAKGPDRRAAKG